MDSADEITVDIDEDFDEWYNGTGFQTIRKRIYDGLYNVKNAYIRRSSSNHVHIKIKFNDGMDLFKKMQMRAFLDDDPHRLACDLDRYYRTGKIENTGRCFDEKYTKGKLKKAGAWIKIL